MLAENINPTKIIDILNGRDTGYSKPKICSIRGDMQLYLGLCKNLFIFMFHAPTIEQGDYIIDDYQLADKRIINYELLKTHIMRKYEEENPEPVVVGRRSTRNRSPNALSPKTKLKTWLERFIDTIEKNYETIDASQLPGYTNLHTIQERKKIVTPAPTRAEEKPIIQNITSRLRNVFNAVPTPTRQSSKKRKRGGGRRRKTMRK
jgi:hypothetical protein